MRVLVIAETDGATGRSINRCRRAHSVATAARLLNVPRERVLSEQEIGALDGRESPHGAIIPEVAD